MKQFAILIITSLATAFAFVLISIAGDYPKECDLPRQDNRSFFALSFALIFLADAILYGAASLFGGVR